ncbi:MAG: glycosyltransferase, partial [bacterium]
EEVIRRGAARSPVAFSAYVEKRNGLSFARNLGAEKSRHEFVAFLDDDATACPDWLASFNAVINEHHALVVVGRVEKAFEPGFAPPAWFDYQYLKGFFGVNYRDRGRNESVIPIRSPLYLGGGNSAYAKRVFDHFGGFDARLGRDGKLLLAGEETYFNLVLESNGIPLYYSDDACIEHFVESYRLTKSHLRRKAYWSGISNAIIQPLCFGYGATLRRTKNNWTEIGDKIGVILRHPRDTENFSHFCRMIYNLAFLQKFYRFYFQHKLKRELEVLPQITWSDEHWLAEVSRWPEGPDKYRELYHYHLFREDKENVRNVLEVLAAYLGCNDLEQVALLLESNQVMNQRQHYSALKQQIRRFVSAHLPEKSNVLVVSRGDDELLELEGRRGWHFPQNGKNVYAGYYPANSAAAIAHLEKLRARGAEFLLFPRPAFWWLGHYADFKTHLKSRYELMMDSQDACLIYDLRK